jgi:hypothetical protein
MRPTQSLEILAGYQKKGLVAFAAFPFAGILPIVAVQAQLDTASVHPARERARLSGSALLHAGPQLRQLQSRPLRKAGTQGSEPVLHDGDRCSSLGFDEHHPADARSGPGGANDHVPFMTQQPLEQLFKRALQGAGKPDRPARRRVTLH